MTPTEGEVVVISKFSVVSRNAILCGGSREISFGGMFVCYLDRCRYDKVGRKLAVFIAVFLLPCSLYL